MSKEVWIGKHNVDSHSPAARRAWNLQTGEWCYPDDWCNECKVTEYGDPWELLENVRAERDDMERAMVYALAEIEMLRKQNLDLVNESDHWASIAYLLANGGAF